MITFMWSGDWTARNPWAVEGEIMPYFGVRPLSATAKMLLVGPLMVVFTKRESKIIEGKKR